jgi:hypothetical protein
MFHENSRRNQLPNRKTKATLPDRRSSQLLLDRNQNCSSRKFSLLTRRKWIANRGCSIERTSPARDTSQNLTKRCCSYLFLHFAEDIGSSKFSHFFFSFFKQILHLFLIFSHYLTFIQKTFTQEHSLAKQNILSVKKWQPLGDCRKNWPIFKSPINPKYFKSKISALQMIRF